MTIVLRMLCIPHAGGTAALFHGWRAALDGAFEVRALELPGHGARSLERPLATIDEMVTRLVEECRQWLDEPYVLFGHSMGALIAYEWADACRRAGRHQPGLLVVAAQHPPPRSRLQPACTHLPDAEFVSEVLTRYGGIPPEVMQHQELLDLVVPALRADLAALEAYRWAPRDALLTCRVMVCRGRRETDLSIEECLGWGLHTSREVSVRTFDGGHFFVRERQADVLAALAEELSAVNASLLRAPGRARAGARRTPSV